jgi:hypothetical protein
MRMLESGNGTRLAEETLLEVRIVGQMAGQDLDCDGALKSGVQRAVHLSHPAGPEERNYRVGPQLCSRRDTHTASQR